MTDTKLLKFYKDVDNCMFKFFNEYLRVKKRPVVTLKLPFNAIDVFYKVISEELGEEVSSFFNKPEHHLQLEAALRIYAVENEHTLTSALLSSGCMKDMLPESTLLHIDNNIKEAMEDYLPYNSTGMQYSYKEGDKVVFPLTFMKYDAPMLSSGKQAIEVINSIVEAIDEVEYGLLEYIWDNKLDSIVKNKRYKFEKQMYILNAIKNKKEDYKVMNKAFYALWNNPFLEDVIITGLIAGMRKIHKGTGSLVHNSVNTFIAMYNEATNVKKG